MTILSDSSIRKSICWKGIEIDPFPADHAFQPASVDLKLGRGFLHVDGTQKWPVQYQDGSSRLELDPGEFCLGTTQERVSVPHGMVARVEGKSSLARMGILVHITAGFIDPGFNGTITLEFCNLSDRCFYLTPGMYICQIAFEELDRPAARPYGHPELKSNYQNQVGVKESKYV